LCLDANKRFIHTRDIRTNYVFLVEKLDVKYSGLVGELYQAKVLSREEMESINSEVISFTQNEKLLSMLSRKNKDQFDKFLDALDKTGQQHVRNHITGHQGQLFRCHFFQFAVNFFSKRKLTFTFAICRRPSVRPSVCSLSVTFVHPTQAIKMFCNVSTPFNTLAIFQNLGKILRRSSKGNPSVGRAEHKRGSQI